jgi:uncharacterized protein (TIGR02145 family)
MAQFINVNAMKHFLVFVCFLLSHFPLFCQTGSISNIQVSQRSDGSGNVDIYYNLNGPSAKYNVNIEISFNNGTTFTVVPSSFLSGNYSVAPGTIRHLIWNGKGSNNDTYSAQTKVKLIANANGPCGQPIIDPRDGKLYNTVQVDLQCWLKENLDIGIRINGGLQQTSNGIIEKYCYNDLESNCSTYGGLYNWNEVMNYLTNQVQGICPDGWHIPSKIEYQTLIDFAGGEYVGGAKLKEVGTVHWSAPNTGATNVTGFTALPSGDYYNGFAVLGTDADYWSSTESSFDAWNFRVNYNDTYATIEADSKDYERGVRCIKNYIP